MGNVVLNCLIIKWEKIRPFLNKGISKHVHCANIYDIFKRQDEIWYFTKNTFLNTFIPPFQKFLKALSNII